MKSVRPNPLRSLTVMLACLSTALFSNGCSTKKNTAFSRFYQQLTTRYNVYYNGNNAYIEQYNKLIDSYNESYTELIFPDPMMQQGIDQERAPKQSTGGAFNTSLEKGRKAIKEHSIRVKPERKDHWRSDPKAVAMQKKTEYNSFLYNAWFLVGKSEFYNADFLQAMATFSYIARLYDTQPVIRNEARAWQARCYAALGWTSEGLNLLKRIQDCPEPELPRKSVFNLARAELLFRDSKFDEIISPLREAIRVQSNSKQKARLNYLLGQILERENRTGEAIEAYKRVLRSNPPFNLDFAATLRKLQLEESHAPHRIIERLERMKRKEKYRTELDALALALGKAYLSLPDTANAVKAFRFGADTSQRKQTDYALCLLHLADIYMQQHRYLLAQPNYQDALKGMKPSDERYEEVNRLATQIGELKGYAQSVAEQDSLQQLAAMPEAERNAVIDKAIKQYIKEEKARKKAEAEQEARESQAEMNEDMRQNNPDSRLTPPDMPGATPTSKDFYFYNPQLIEQGKKQFEKKWGKRALEDHWQRRKKRINTGNVNGPADAPAANPSDSTAQSGTAVKQKAGKEPEPAPEDDPTNRAYYLKSIPMTPEAKQQSDEIIEKGLDGMGTVFSEKMNAFADALFAFNRLINQYPGYPGRQDVLYKMYLIGERTNDRPLINRCITLSQKEYPDAALTKAISDPQYLAKLKQGKDRENRLYDEALTAYFEGQTKVVRHEAEALRKEYPNSDLSPRMLFLEALADVADNRPEAFKAKLDTLVNTYPKADAATLATLMLNDLLKGRKIAAGSYKDVYQNFDISVQTTDAPNGAPEDFKPKSLAESESLLLLYPARMLSAGKANYVISLFNFSRFTNHVFELQTLKAPPYEVVLINGFDGKTLLETYLQKAYAPDGMLSAFGPQAILLPISKENAELIKKGRSIGEYLRFAQTLQAQRQPASPAFSLVWDRWHSILNASTAPRPGSSLPPQAKRPIDDTGSKKTIEKTARPNPNAARKTAKAMQPCTVSLLKVAPIAEADSLPSVFEPREAAPPAETTPAFDKREGLTYEEVEAMVKQREAAEKKAQEEAEKRRKEDLKAREKARKEREKAIEEKRRQREKDLKAREKERAKAIRERERQRPAKSLRRTL